MMHIAQREVARPNREATLFAFSYVVALAIIGASHGQISVHRSLTWLGVVPGYDASVAYSVSGYVASHFGPIVVGSVYKIGSVVNEDAFVWSARHGLRLLDLSSLGALDSVARGVSSDGRVIVGEFVRIPPYMRAFAVIDGQPIELPCVGEECGAYDVSADGTVAVGWTLDTNGMPRACYWTIDLQRRRAQVSLLSSDGFYRSYSYGVAPDRSAAVGMHQFANCGCPPGGNWRTDCFRGVLWQPLSGALIDLGTAGGRVSIAYAVSQLGRRVVGTSETVCAPWGDFRAFLYCNRRMFVLDTLAPLVRQLTATGTAYDISADGTRVVGNGLGLDSGSSAFLWIESTREACPPAGRLLDLNLYVYGAYRANERLTSAHSINGSYIVGQGVRRGVRQAFLLLYTDASASPE